MSFHAVVAALDIQGIDPASKFLLVVLASYANTDNTAWPSQATLAHDTCMSERTIRTHLTKLEEAGLIQRDHRRAGNRRTSDFISLPFVPAKSAGRGDFEPAKFAVSTGKKCISEPAKSAGKPIIEPKIERGATSPSPAEWQATRRPKGQEREKMRMIALELARTLGAPK